MASSKAKFYSKDEAHFKWATWGGARAKAAPAADAANGSRNGNGNRNGAVGVKIIPQEELQVSNDQCPSIDGLTVIQDLLSEEEADQLIQEIQSRAFTWEGFEQRRRVQRYSDIPARRYPAEDNDGKDDDDDDNHQTSIMPATLQLLMDRLADHSGHWPQHVSIEEHSTQQTRKVTQYGFNGYNAILTSFETTTGNDSCPCCQQQQKQQQPGKIDACQCFVAQMPLQGSAVKHWNKPKRRHPTCFDLETPHHWNDIRLDPQSLMIQTGDCLWNWRSRVAALPSFEYWEEGEESPNSNQSQSSSIISSESHSGNLNSTFLILKFYNLPPESSSTITSTNNSNNTTSEAEQDVVDENFSGIDYDAFGFMGTPETSQCSLPMPPLEDVLTIIVTTSPIKSNPSTEVIEKTFESFLLAGHDFAVKCRKVIVCDGCRRLDDESEKVSRRHVNAKQAMRNGIVSETQAENYHQFKAALRRLTASAPDQSPLYNPVVEQLDSRHGYGFALRHALRRCVTTPYVCVIQHDRTFMRPTPMLETTRAMWHHRYVKYVTISMRSNLLYRDLFIGKYGKTYCQEFDEMILRLPELNLDGAMYGPDGQSAQQMTCDNRKVRASIQALQEKYKGSTQNQVQQDWMKSNPPADPTKHQLTLTPVGTVCSMCVLALLCFG